jgi:hypothetical protein
LLNFVAQMVKALLFQLSYYTPSGTYKNDAGKSISKRPMGYIQSHFVNFWQANKPVKDALLEIDEKDEGEELNML